MVFYFYYSGYGGGINGLENLYLTIYTDGGCLDISPSYRPNIGSVSLQVNVMFNNTTGTQMPDGGCRYKVDWVHGNGSIFREGEEYYISFGLHNFNLHDTFTYRFVDRVGVYDDEGYYQIC